MRASFLYSGIISMAGLALTVLVECFTAEWEVTGPISGAGTILRVLKQLRNGGTAIASQMTRPSCGSDDHIIGLPVSSRRRKNSVPG